MCVFICDACKLNTSDIAQESLHFFSLGIAHWRSIMLTSPNGEYFVLLLPMRNIYSGTLFNIYLISLLIDVILNHTHSPVSSYTRFLYLSLSKNILSD